MCDMMKSLIIYFITLATCAGYAQTNAVTQLAVINVTDPVDLKCATNGNLYVLSGRTATITEFGQDGKTIRSLKNLGTMPSGFDVDDSGNVYVALTKDNQVWKFTPTEHSFQADRNFGHDGLIGNADKSPGNESNAFNEPYDVAVAAIIGGNVIFVSDTGNNRTMHFTAEGSFIDSFGIETNSVGPLDSPKGLVCDDYYYLLIADSGNNRLVLTDGDYISQKAYGMKGSDLGQFQNPSHISVNERGIYVADTGNNRIEIFSPLGRNETLTRDPLIPRLSLSSELGLSHPKAVAAVRNLLEERIYIADTGNNRVLLVRLPLDNPEAIWLQMDDALKTGNLAKVNSFFSIAAVDNYSKAFRGASKAELARMADDIRSIKPVFLMANRAQYYIETMIHGVKAGFPIEFVKENGQWKILEF